MPRSPKLARSVSDRVSKVPWALVLEIGRWIYYQGRDAYARLNEHERRELPRLLRESKGRATNLTERERAELRRIVTKAVGLGRP
jgi:hypothetical protein